MSNERQTMPNNIILQWDQYTVISKRPDTTGQYYDNFTDNDEAMRFIQEIAPECTSINLHSIKNTLEQIKP